MQKDCSWIFCIAVVTRVFFKEGALLSQYNTSSDKNSLLFFCTAGILLLFPTLFDV